ncbi:MAG: preprotein translocase subunit YajC [Synergistales bacterium]|nr:preprotein translocase subunit YajC [Synergistales bacterium]
MLMPLVLFGVIFYFLILRPQKKKKRQHEEMLASIRKGDKVVTAGGFWGTVKDLKGDSFIVEIADGIKARVMKASISFKMDSAQEEAMEESSEEETEQESGSGD